MQKLKHDRIEVLQLITQGTGKKSLLIIAHRDIDGLITAYLLGRAMAHKYKRIDVIFAQLCFVSSVVKFIARSGKADSYDDIALVDLSVDYSHPQTTLTTLDLLDPRLRFIFDHHKGWPAILEGKGFKYPTDPKDMDKYRNAVINDTASCAAMVIYDFFNMKELHDVYLNDLCVLAAVSDDLSYRNETKDTKLIEIFKNFKNNTLESNLEILQRATRIADVCNDKPNYYRIHTRKSREFLKSAVELAPGVCYIQADHSDDLNYTNLCEQAYKDEYRVVIIKELNARNLRISYTIGHNIPNLDLTEVFELEGGNPRRITLSKTALSSQKILNKLKPYL